MELLRGLCNPEVVTFDTTGNIVNTLPHYVGFGHETCPQTQRKHLQGMMRYKHQVSYPTLIKLIPLAFWNHAYTHIKHSFEINRKYCSKEGNFEEYGVPPADMKKGMTATKYLAEQGVNILANVTTLANEMEIRHIKSRLHQISMLIDHYIYEMGNEDYPEPPHPSGWSTDPADTSTASDDTVPPTPIPQTPVPFMPKKSCIHAPNTSACYCKDRISDPCNYCQKHDISCSNIIINIE